MKINKIYESIILEAEIEACVKKFGDILFGDELAPGKEKNTSVENNYVNYIKQFTTTDYGQDIKPNIVKALTTLKGCVQQYPEVLIPDKTKVYRGITIPAEYFIKNKIPIKIDAPFPYIYKARNSIQSWSENFDIASTFGNHEILNEVADNIDYIGIDDFSTIENQRKLLQFVIGQDLRMAFVLEYVTNPKEFLFKTKYFNKLSAGKHEDEIIRIDNKPIKVLAKFNLHEDVFLSGDGLRLIKHINHAIKNL